MDAKYAKYKYDFDWGEVTQEDILRRIDQTKTLEEMSEQEINQMLDDLI